MKIIEQNLNISLGMNEKYWLPNGKYHLFEKKNQEVRKNKEILQYLYYENLKQEVELL